MIKDSKARSALTAFLPMGLAICLGGTLGSACGDFVPLSRIDDLRVLGARVSSQRDPSSSAILAGDEATLRLFVVAPEETPSFRSAFVACESGKPSTSNNLRCASEPFATEMAESSTAVENASFTFLVPNDAKELLVLGVLCKSSAPRLDRLIDRSSAGAEGCEGGEEDSIEFSLNIPIALENTSSPIPSFPEDGILFNNAGWPPSDSDCGNPDLIRVSATAAAIPIGFTNPQVLSGESSRVFEVSTFSTAGEQSRAFTALDESTMVEDLTWKPQATFEDAEPLGTSEERLVRFFFVLRDEVLGSDFTERRLCLTP